jgi:hypothetical protein
MPSLTSQTSKTTLSQAEKVAMNTWSELANAHGANHDALATCVINLAQAEVEVEGLQTLLLPAERVTAIHEAGHAVNDFRLGSSLDKWVMASKLVQGAALALRRDPEVLLASCIGATLYVLQPGGSPRETPS